MIEWEKGGSFCLGCSLDWFDFVKLSKGVPNWEHYTRFLQSQLAAAGLGFS